MQYKGNLQYACTLPSSAGMGVCAGRTASLTTGIGGQKHSWTVIALQGPDLQEVLAIAMQLCPWLGKPAGDWGRCRGRKNFIGKKC